MPYLLFVFFILVSAFSVQAESALFRQGYDESELNMNNANCELQYLTATELKSMPAKKLGSLKIGQDPMGVNCTEDFNRALIEEDACGLSADYVIIQDIRITDACWLASAYFFESLDNVANPQPSINPSEPYEAQNPAPNKQVAADLEDNPVVLILGYALGFVIGFTLTTMILN